MNINLIRKNFFLSNGIETLRLCDGTLQDEYFPGLNFVIEQMSRLKDYQLLWRNIDWVMNINQANAIKIFTQREADELASERMRPDIIIDYLMNYKEALVLYLEYLIYEKNIKVNKQIKFSMCIS